MSCFTTAQLRSPGSERCQDLHSHTAEPETRPSSAIPTPTPDQGAFCCPGVWQEGTEQASVMPLGLWAFLTSSPIVESPGVLLASAGFPSSKPQSVTLGLAPASGCPLGAPGHSQLVRLTARVPILTYPLSRGPLPTQRVILRSPSSAPLSLSEELLWELSSGSERKGVTLPGLGYLVIGVPGLHPD